MTPLDGSRRERVLLFETNATSYHCLISNPACPPLKMNHVFNHLKFIDTVGMSRRSLSSLNLTSCLVAPSSSWWVTCEETSRHFPLRVKMISVWEAHTGCGAEKAFPMSHWSGIAWPIPSMEGEYAKGHILTRELYGPCQDGNKMIILIMKNLGKKINTNILE